MFHSLKHCSTLCSKRSLSMKRPRTMMNRGRISCSQQKTLFSSLTSSFSVANRSNSLLHNNNNSKILEFSSSAMTMNGLKNRIESFLPSLFIQQKNWLNNGFNNNNNNNNNGKQQQKRRFSSGNNGYDRLQQAKWLVYAIMGVNAAVFFKWQNNSFPSRDFMMRNFTCSLYNVEQGRWWTLITCTYSQKELNHLLFNMLSLYILAPYVGK
jgi:hypothetical protein